MIELTLHKYKISKTSGNPRFHERQPASPLSHHHAPISYSLGEANAARFANEVLVMQHRVVPGDVQELEYPHHPLLGVQGQLLVVHRHTGGRAYTDTLGGGTF